MTFDISKQGFISEINIQGGITNNLNLGLV